jgi:hypothetical protein
MGNQHERKEGELNYAIDSPTSWRRDNYIAQRSQKDYAGQEK